MVLPDDFINEMGDILGHEGARSLVDALGKPATTSIRLNRKFVTDETRAELDTMLHQYEATCVPWCEEGFYLTERPAFIMDPLFHAGAYYAQEASSMFIAHLINIYIGSKDVNVLDLCAAPGGKSTLLLSLLSDKSTLVANEIVPKRASILKENLSKWGNSNVIVTNNKPKDYKEMENVFDLILCDAPCSGEGMFRKDETAVNEWSLQNVEMCQRRQREIVADIWDCLKPGGLFIYSTCTFNTRENEENVKWISENLGAGILPCYRQDEWGISGNLLPHESFDCCHFLPHKARGEGFFCAIMRKDGEHDNKQIRITSKMTRRLKLLSLVSRTQDSVEHVDVDKPTALQYLRGEAVKLGPSASRGIVTITYKHMPLGQAKNIGSRANNLYPKEWRIKKQL